MQRTNATVSVIVLSAVNPDTAAAVSEVMMTRDLAS